MSTESTVFWCHKCDHSFQASVPTLKCVSCFSEFIEQMDGKNVPGGSGHPLLFMRQPPTESPPYKSNTLQKSTQQQEPETLKQLGQQQLQQLPQTKLYTNTFFRNTDGDEIYDIHSLLLPQEISTQFPELFPIWNPKKQPITTNQNNNIQNPNQVPQPQPQPKSQSQTQTQSQRWNSPQLFLWNTLTGIVGTSINFVSVGVERVDDFVDDVLRSRFHLGAPPASQQAIDQCTILKYDSGHHTGQTSCPICQESFTKDDSVKELPCNHIFHPACVEPWLHSRNSCPVCRFELKTDDKRYERNKQRREKQRGDNNS